MFGKVFAVISTKTTEKIGRNYSEHEKMFFKIYYNNLLFIITFFRTMAASKFASNQFTIFVILFSILFLVLFGLFGKYSGESLPTGSPDYTKVSRDYPRKLEYSFFIYDKYKIQFHIFHSPF